MQPRDLLRERLDHLGVLLALLAERRAEAPEVGADAAGLEERVLDGLEPPARVLRQDPTLGVAPLAEVEEDRARLPHHEPVVLEHGDLVVRVQRQELGTELLAGGEVHAAHLVGEPELLEGDRDLPAVRRLRGVEPDHGISSSCHEERRGPGWPASRARSGGPKKLLMTRTGLAALALAGALAAPAAGAPIPVSNPSFEDVVLADGARANALNADAATVPGWSSVFAGPGVTNGGIHDPQDAQFTGSTGDDAALPGHGGPGPGALPPGHRGRQHRELLDHGERRDGRCRYDVHPHRRRRRPARRRARRGRDPAPRERHQGRRDDHRRREPRRGDLHRRRRRLHDDLPATRAPAASSRSACASEVTLASLQAVYFDRVELEDTVVPEPAAVLLAAAGAAVLALARRRAR